MPRKSERRLAKLLTLMAFCAVPSVLSACKQVEEATSANSSVYNPEEGVVDDSAGFYMRARASDNYTYYTHRGSTSLYNDSGSYTYNTECKVSATETSVGARNLLCYVEAEELDLYFNGVSLQFNVPKSMCDYVKFSPPYYFKFPGGVGPTAASYELSAAGVYSNEVHTSNGTPVCSFDYSTVFDDGPNCCFGKYSLTAVVDGTPSVSQGDWGGKISDCLSGPAMDTQAKTKSGFPMPDLYYVSNSGLNKVYNVAAPISKQHGSNIFAANYFNSTDYANDTTYHKPFKPTVSPAGHTVYSGTTQPFFELTCLNRNHEALARIRLMVRSWDYTGFSNVAAVYDDTHGGNDGTGSDTGTEPTYGGANHDYSIWPDATAWGAGYTAEFPGIFE